MPLPLPLSPDVSCGGWGGKWPGLGVSFNRIDVRPEFPQSVQVLRIEGNPWLLVDDSTDAATPGSPPG
jgi:hypothetical protein